MTQQQLAEAIGYQSRSAIAKIESGANEVPLSKLVPFARALDTTVELLLVGMDDEITGETRSNERIIKVKKRPFKVAAIILAGGKSTRNLQNIPNQFINILGKPVIGYCMTAYQNHPMIDDIFVVCLNAFHDVLEAYAKRFGINKLREICLSGSTGIVSARNGLEAALRYGYRDSDLVVFQESTRPLVNEEAITRLLSTAKEKGIAITAAPMDDNVQFLRCSDGSYEYIDRDKVVDLQSPDAYKIATLRKAFVCADANEHSYAESNIAMFLYNLGFKIHFCYGSPNNIKIVRQEDIAVATALLKRRE